MSRRLFCGSQAPPSLTPELLPVPVELAKETRLTVKPNREDDFANENPWYTFVAVALSKIYDYRDRRDTLESWLVSPPFLSFPFLRSCLRSFFLSLLACICSPLLSYGRTRQNRSQTRARETAYRGARFIWLCNLRGITTFL